MIKGRSTIKSIINNVDRLELVSLGFEELDYAKYAEELLDEAKQYGVNL